MKLKTIEIYAYVLLIVFSALFSKIILDDLYQNEFKKQLASINYSIEEIGQINNARAAQIQTKILKSHVTQRTISADISTTSIPVSGKAILADLTAMKLTLYEDGEAVSELGILAKGKEGSRYETPIGQYKILTKEVNHLSSLGTLYMPYSMEFFGNFFIHGRPYYLSGKELPDGDSGGCIRLSTTDAKKVFAFAERGTPVIVIEPELGGQSSETVTSLIHKAGSISEIPKVVADAYLVADVNTGFVFVESNPEKLVHLSTLTKIMTAVVSDEIFRSNHQITVDSTNPLDDKSESVQTGDVLTISEILRPLIMKQSNLAAASIASSFGNKSFVSLMNKKASAIGMSDTVFTDSTGVSATNVSTANDLFNLTKYLYKKHPYISKLTLKQKYSIDKTREHNSYEWTNDFLNVSTTTVLTLNGKTADSKEIGVSVFNMELNASSSSVAVIVLGSDFQDKDTQTLLDWTRQNYSEEKVVANI